MAIGTQHVDSIFNCELLKMKMELGQENINFPYRVSNFKNHFLDFLAPLKYDLAVVWFLTPIMDQ